MYIWGAGRTGDADKPPSALIPFYLPHTHTKHTHTHLDMVAVRSEREEENLDATVRDFLRLLLPSAVDDFSKKRLEIN